MKLNCSWDDWAVVVGGDSDSRNRDQVVMCVAIATDEEERTLRNLGLDWGGWLWRVNRVLVWVDNDGKDHWLPFAPDARLRRINGIGPAGQAEVAVA